MPTGHHTPIADNADINCATFNSPLSELDEAVEELRAAVEELKAWSPLGWVSTNRSASSGAVRRKCRLGRYRDFGR